MTGISWVLEGTEYGNCNCDHGCPCQFNGRPFAEQGDAAAQAGPVYRNPA